MSSDRYYGYGQSHNGGRPLSYNPATTSVPSSIGYSSLYAGDMHVVPNTSNSRHHLTPRGYYTSTAPGGVPTTTRTFAVNHDPRTRSTRETSRTRRSTLDSTSRPPVIVTTSSHKDRANATSSHSSGTRSANSPTRDDYYSQSSPNPRHSRHHGRTSSASYDDEYYRHRDSSLSRAEAYRSSRPSVVYPSDPRHSTAAVDFGGADYGTDGYQYTNAGELARYDLDNPRASRRRRDSMDRGYYRPSLTYNADQRSLNVNTTPDLSRNYTSNTSRVYDGRGGPPPSTRGFDRINSRYDGPQGGPVPPSPTSSSFEVGGGATRRGRPVSMYQEGTSSSSIHDDIYRARDDERGMRDVRDRDSERLPSSGLLDDSVTTRGFGLRTGPLPAADAPERRREPRTDEAAKRSDESLKRDSDTERHERHERPHERGASDDLRRERREGRRGSDDEEKERTRLRDKVTGGLSIAAAAVGLGSTYKDDDKGDKDKDKEPQPRRRPSPGEDDRKPKDALPADVPKASEANKDLDRLADDVDLTRQRPAAETEGKEPLHHDVEERHDGEAVAPASGSDTDEGRRARRRHRASRTFDPNDASDITKLKEQLAAMKTSDKGVEANHASSQREEARREDSPRSEMTLVERPRDESRGREASAAHEGKQVRLVSPPRDKKTDKPVRGILKTPSASFPEEANPVREGVAPHKEDKKLKEVPPGARWTKISRRKVNPEALEIGKERFEVRDDFVIVLRVLSKEEIQAYAAATQILRERRRNKDRDIREPEKDREDDEGDDAKRRHHRHRDEEDEEERERNRERDPERRSRRHKRTGDDDDYDDPYHHQHHSHHHQRSFRERERERGRERDWVDP